MRSLLLVGLVTFLAAHPAAARAGWLPPQDLGPAGIDLYANAIASNGRGDTVVAFSGLAGMYVARAAPGAPFAAAVRVDADGERPRVVVDPSGVALVAWEYDEVTSDARDLHDEWCCTGTKALVWRPGRAPSKARALVRRGRNAVDARLAAVGGRRAVVFDESGPRAEPIFTSWFVPIGLDGRPGLARRVVGGGWTAQTLQFEGDRAIVGLVKPGRPSRLAVRVKRPDRAFGPIRPFRTVPDFLGRPPDPLWAKLAPDGRGGHVAALVRGPYAAPYLELVRKPRRGDLRRVLLRPRRATSYIVSAPAVASDGWVALAFAYAPNLTAPARRGYVAALRPDGRAVVTALPDAVEFPTPVATVRPGGAGAAGLDGAVPETVGTVSRISLSAIAAGRPLAGETLRRDGHSARHGVAMTSSRRERARVVFSAGGRVLASRLPW